MQHGRRRLRSVPVAQAPHRDFCSMRYLVHVSQLLDPPDTGGKIRSLKLFERLSRANDVTIVCFRRPTDTPEQVEKMKTCCTRLEMVERPAAALFSAGFYLSLASNLFSRYPYNVQKYYDPRMEGRIGELMQERPYDVLICDYVVPLRIGGGTRLKIMEAMAMAKPVVSTNVGAEGLPVQDGEDIILADDPSVFAERVVGLLKDGQRRRTLGQAGLRHAHERHSWEIATKDLDAVCERVARAARGTAPSGERGVTARREQTSL